MQSLWRRRRFRYVENVLDGLSSASHLGEAWALDREAARPSTASDKWRPSVRQFDEHLQTLVSINNALERLTSAMTEGRHKPDFILPPFTAADWLQQQAESEANARALSIARTLIPGV